jgi:hypothetical protein
MSITHTPKNEEQAEDLPEDPQEQLDRRKYYLQKLERETAADLQRIRSQLNELNWVNKS